MKTCTKCAARLPLRFFHLVLGENTAACDFFPVRYGEEQHLDADAKRARSAGDLGCFLCWKLTGIGSNVCTQFAAHRKRGIKKPIYVLLHFFELRQFATENHLLRRRPILMGDDREQPSNARDRRIKRSAVPDERGQLVTDLDGKVVQPIRTLLCTWGKWLTPICDELIQGFDVRFPSRELSDETYAATLQLPKMGWQLRNLFQHYSSDHLPVRLLSAQELMVLLGSDSRGFLGNLSRSLRCAIGENRNYRRCYGRNETNHDRCPIRHVAPVCCQRTHSHNRSSLISGCILP